MFKNVLRKIVGYGLALCLVGTIALSGPITTLTVYDGVAPFGITDPEGDYY